MPATELHRRNALNTMFTLTCGSIILGQITQCLDNKQTVFGLALGLLAVGLTNLRVPNDDVADSVGILIALVNVPLVLLAWWGIDMLVLIPGFGAVVRNEL